MAVIHKNDYFISVLSVWLSLVNALHILNLLLMYFTVTVVQHTQMENILEKHMSYISKTEFS